MSRPVNMESPPRVMDQVQPRMNYAAAFWGGVLGALVMTILMGLGVWMQWSRFGLEMLLGSFVTGRVDTGSWLLGFAWHLLNGGLFGMAYGLVFRSVGRASPGIGAATGIVNWLLAGLLISALQSVHPLLDPSNRIGGFFYWTGAGGMTLLGSLVLHLVFGAIVGKTVARAWPRSRTEGIAQDVPLERKAS